MLTPALMCLAAGWCKRHAGKGGCTPGAALARSHHHSEECAHAEGTLPVSHRQEGCTSHPVSLAGPCGSHCCPGHQVQISSQLLYCLHGPHRVLVILLPLVDQLRLLTSGAEVEFGQGSPLRRQINKPLKWSKVASLGNVCRQLCRIASSPLPPLLLCCLQICLCILMRRAARPD